ncbi:hypothetical protein PIROE2DRAFT_63757 [Piromyces sp. E2]|nr:hypothetical protein PIROE2DRAFT_63757 [Piromyces sp. E2]|eukprot:OUM59477.1 hypothetical protein PIROE2DRAFT_63757 [Piromyces sp. E2]
MERLVQKKRTRNYGVDILKMLSMFMVVTLHTLGNGGVLESTEKNSLNFAVAYFIETAALCAVNVFAMTSGYLIVNSKCSYLKIIPLWLSVFFYSSIISILFKFVPYIKRDISIKDFIKCSFLPTLNKDYWYFTSYFGLYFFIPYINKALHAISKQEHKKLVITIIVLYAVLPLVHLYRVDVFEVKRGYSPIWLGALYVVGAYFKLYPVKVSKLVSFLMYIVSVIIAWSSIFTEHIDFLNYDSFFIITSGISLLLFFTQVNITSKRLQKLIVLGSSVSFSVYLIQDHPSCRHFLKNKLKNFAKDPFYLLILKVLATAGAIYLSASIIDLFRHYLFKYLKVNNIPKLLKEKFSESRVKETDSFQKLNNNSDTENGKDSVNPMDKIDERNNESLIVKVQL